MSIENFVVVEDDLVLANQFKSMLEMMSFKVNVFHTAEDMLYSRVSGQEPSIYLIDLNLPGVRGLELIKLIRYADKLSPIFVISGAANQEEMSECFKCGADDYLVKPYNPDHLMLKIQNAQNKFQLMLDSMVDIGIKLIPEANIVVRDGKKIKLTSREYSIIEQLMQNPDGIHTREELAKSLGEKEVLDRTIDVHVSSLRRKIRDISVGIETYRGQGYKIVMEENGNRSAS